MKLLHLSFGLHQPDMQVDKGKHDLFWAGFVYWYERTVSISWNPLGTWALEILCMYGILAMFPPKKLQMI